MENVHAERSAGWSVLCYVGVLVLATFLNTGLPSVFEKAPHAALILDTRHVALILAAWLTFPAAAFFLWFLVGLRAYLTCAPGRQEGLPMLAMTAGIVMTALAVVAGAFETAAAYASPDMFSNNGLMGIYDAFVFTQGGLGYAPVAIFLFASAHSMRRHDSAPPWLAWLGYLAAIGAGIASLSVFFADGFMAPGQEGPGLFGALPAAVWLVCTGVVLIQSKRSSPVLSSTSTAS